MIKSVEFEDVELKDGLVVTFGVDCYVDIVHDEDWPASFDIDDVGFIKIVTVVQNSEILYPDEILEMRSYIEDLIIEHIEYYGIIPEVD